MAMLPKQFRFWLFDYLSLKTMRYVHATPRSKASGIVEEVYSMIEDDFFINGSLTSRSKVPPLLAGIWACGRESILVTDKLDRTTKEAMIATLSSINDCPYCGDMLVSLVHAGNRHDDANHILNDTEQHITDPLLRERLLWVRSIATPGATPTPTLPFNQAELPEAIACLMAMADINRFSHVVMDGSPVKAPFGLDSIKEFALRVFGGELRTTHTRPLSPGRSLHLLPPAILPDDLSWASSHPRIAQAIAQYARTVEEEGCKVIPEQVQQTVHHSLQHWQGERMPLSRHWVEDEISDLHGHDKNIARLAIVLAKAPYQADEKLYTTVFNACTNEQDFIRLINWACFTASRYFASRLVQIAHQQLPALQAA